MAGLTIKSDHCNVRLFRLNGSWAFAVYSVATGVEDDLFEAGGYGSRQEAFAAADAWIGDVVARGAGHWDAFTPED